MSSVSQTPVRALGGFARRFAVSMMGLFYGGFAINLFIAFIPGRTMWTLLFG